jgi:hypothetical protein
MTPAVARADAAPQTVERRVLEIVRTLVDELGGLKGRGPVALDDALDPCSRCAPVSPMA